MIDTLKDRLSNWFLHSGMEGLYVLGSYSLGEQNFFSDIDFLGLTKETLSGENISLIRDELRKELKDTVPFEKIGFRVRSQQELVAFQSKLKSWGYDLLNAKRLFGHDLSLSLKPTTSTSVDLKLVFDNLIEKEWYDILCLNRQINTKQKNYACAKTLLDITTFVLYFNGIFFPTNKERLNYINNNKCIIKNLPITTYELSEALMLRNNPDSFQSDIDFEILRYKLLNETYLLFVPIFRNMEADFANLNYWNYDSTTFNPVKEIANEILDKESITYLSEVKNIFFVWRVVLINLLLRLDSLTLSNSISQISEVTEAIESLVRSGLIAYSRTTDKSAVRFLNNLEHLRITSSDNGKDSSRKFEVIQ